MFHSVYASKFDVDRSHAVLVRSSRALTRRMPSFLMTAISWWSVFAVRARLHTVFVRRTCIAFVMVVLSRARVLRWTRQCFTQGKAEYKIKWLGYDLPKYNTWEPADHIPADIVRDYEETNKNSKKQTREHSSSATVKSEKAEDTCWNGSLKKKGTHYCHMQGWNANKRGVVERLPKDLNIFFQTETSYVMEHLFSMADVCYFKPSNSQEDRSGFEKLCDSLKSYERSALVLLGSRGEAKEVMVLVPPGSFEASKVSIPSDGMLGLVLPAGDRFIVVRRVPKDKSHLK